MKYHQSICCGRNRKRSDIFVLTFEEIYELFIVCLEMVTSRALHNASVPGFHDFAVTALKPPHIPLAARVVALAQSYRHERTP